MSPYIHHFTTIEQQTSRRRIHTSHVPLSIGSLNIPHYDNVNVHAFYSEKNTLYTLSLTIRCEAQ